jgi:hypothetical protein
VADIVAKVFLGWRRKISTAADALYARRREGPYRFIQNRSRTSVVALKSDAAAEFRPFQGQHGVEEHAAVAPPKIDFREILRVVRFSTFATISALFRRSAMSYLSRLSPVRDPAQAMAHVHGQEIEELDAPPFDS